ncbi:putative transcription factor IIIB 90 kDa subunit [Triangularia setosa]|uniref:Transcription factor IIIB 90 kDa subunit n=1 Tax=Triangularia setosa TaxID=2587417 RepID=A0AAN7A5K3_9PEZI|nr:putative transcription factor IIIB 90 kDa subunit [Podospora setosa]
MVYQLHVPQQMAEQALEIYKTAVKVNFVKGRRKQNVAAVCMYAACRVAGQNQIMLLDLADIVKTDVFHLGRNFKELLRRIPHLDNGYNPLTLEDLIYRFATKLEFLHDTNKVATSAIRIARRMMKDSISIGRRPAGISGAAIIMAARAHNYRRTVREVVYIAKVTMATLQERMAEFAAVPAAGLSIKEFMENDDLHPAASHDPPSVYKQSKEWLEQHPKRAKKRKASAANPEDVEGSQESDQQGASKRQRTSSDAETPDSEIEEASAPNVDKDGFVIPPNPKEKPKDKELLSVHEQSLLIGGLGTTDDRLEVEALAREFYEDEDGTTQEYDASSEMAMAQQQGIEIPGLSVKIKPRAPPTAAAGDSPASDVTEGAQNKNTQAKQPKPQLPLDESWVMDEEIMVEEVEGYLGNPANARVIEEVVQEEQQLKKQPGIQLAGETSAEETSTEQTPVEQTPAEQTLAVETAQPSEAPSNTTSNEEAETSSSTAAPSSRPVVVDPLLDPIVREDEFENDPEVMFCRLSDEDCKIKTQIWFNQNKDWLRKRQQKIFEEKMAKSKPKKKSQGKKARIGEGQSGPAASAAEAAEQMLVTRALQVSRKLDYGKMDNLFTINQGGPGSAGTQSGIASATVSDNGEEDDEEMSDAPAQPTSTAPATAAKGNAAALTDEEDDNEDDYQHQEENYEQEYDGANYDQEEYGDGYNPWG